MAANLQNLRTQTPEEARENGRKGGIASGKARRERKTVKKLLDEFLETDVSTNKQLKALAKKVGIEGNASIKRLYIIVTIMNSLKNANFDDLEKLQSILGEDLEATNSTQTIEDDPLTKSLIEEAKKMNENTKE